ncbi:MAG: ABC transporter permease [Clostridiales bacterium]|nr:ABC transporter permease [Clostridiales bacterium]
MKTVEKALRRPVTGILISIVMGFVVGAVVLVVAGYDPVAAYSAMLQGIFSKPKYMVQVLIRCTPLILTGLSISFAFKTGMFNIGAEGQAIIGMVTAVVVGYCVQLPPVVHFLVVAAAAMAAAGLWGALVGVLKSRFGIHEVISGIMLNWIALYFNNYMISMPWLKKPQTEASYEALESSWIVILNSWKNSDAGRAWLLDGTHPVLSDVLIKTDMNYGIFIAIGMAVLVWFVLGHTTKGYEMRAVGSGSEAARFAGIHVDRNIIQSLAMAGALAGLAGAIVITGAMPHRITTLTAQPGYGFDGISVALMANTSPLGVIASALLFAGLQYGGSSIQAELGAPSEIINIVIGTIIFFIAMSGAFKMLADYLEKRRGRTDAE